MSWRFPFYRQLDSMDCGPSCLRMVAAHHGRHYTLNFLRENSFIDRDGVSVAGIVRAAEQIGFETIAAAVPLRADEDHQVGLVDLPQPCIVHWEQKHFVVVYRTSDRFIWIADPALGRLKLTHKEFLAGWCSQGEEKGIVLVLSPTPAFFEQEGQTKQRTGFGYLFYFLHPYKRLIFQLALGLLTLGILQLIFPFLTQAIVDIGIDNRDFDFIILILVGQLFLFAGQTVINLLQGWILLHIGTRVNVSLVSQFLSKIMRLPLAFFDQKSTGDLLQRIYDQRRIETFLTSTSLTALFSLFTLFVLGIVLFIYHTGIALIFLVSAALYAAYILLFLRKRALIDHQRFRELTDNQNILIELIQGMPEIKLQQSERRRRWSWVSVQNKLFRTNIRFLTVTQWQDTGAQVISQLKDIIIIVVAAKAVIDGQLSLGMMLAIQFVTGQMNVPLQRLVGFIRTAQDAQLSLERLGELHHFKDEDEDRLERVADLPEQADLVMEQLSFAYNELAGPVLQDIDLCIPHGKMTAIVGASGSGKTTLIKLLLGFYEPAQGQLRVGSLPLSGISLETWRAACGAVLQDGFIFSDTIARNIAESSDLIEPKRVMQAAETANIRDFIESLPQGYRTKVGAHGNGLSQGQRQRLLIARAIYKSPDYLFFDEATNALDAANESQIVRNLNAFFENRTVVVVAHRLSTVRDADQIIVLDQGRIVERGTHEELTARKGQYYNLIKNQLELGQ